MKILQPNETTLVGEWRTVAGKMQGNEACDRIDYLLNHVLQKIGQDASGWSVLFRDPGDGRYWELTYPQGHIQGGGPPALKCLSLSQVESKYRLKL